MLARFCPRLKPARPYVSNMYQVPGTRLDKTRLEGTGVTANALHPGVVASNFMVTNNPGWTRILRWIFNLFSISLTKGAETSVYLATSDEVAGVTGKHDVLIFCLEFVDI
jgi:hypothetical protein